MPRAARIVVPGAPHHVTQRGNRRQQTFFQDADYLLYLQLLRRYATDCDVKVWGYCLMPNHVHLLLTPPNASALSAVLSAVHKRYTHHINRRERWTGYLWQGRFASSAMDDAYFVAASRYVGLNPVRAELTRDARDWPWSSVRAHLGERDDPVVDVAPLLSRIDGDAARFFACDLDREAAARLRRAQATGKPLGGRAWLRSLEQTFGKALIERLRGRPLSVEAIGVG
ncbi:MAG: transposase [Alphaproteobacteria bacterium]|nr:transposase [Alphaproteobacteria bacterium]